jgi:hypothetical protein
MRSGIPHMCMMPLFVQSMQRCPYCPHTVVLVPGWHAPVESQHPLLHVRWPHVPPEPLPPELLELLPPVQLALTHIWPVAHVMHAAPPKPQAVGSDVPV